MKRTLNYTVKNGNYSELLYKYNFTNFSVITIPDIKLTNDFDESQILNNNIYEIISNIYYDHTNHKNITYANRNEIINIITRKLSNDDIICDISIMYKTMSANIEYIVNKYKIKNIKAECEFFTIQKKPHGFYLHENELQKIDVTDELLELHYQEVNGYKTLIDMLTTQNQGLFLLHGEPGTGKSTILEYIISSVKKQVIFVPSNMITYFTSPEFMTFIIKYKNSILILEDAENVLKSRDNNDNQSISNILNLTSGLLNKSLGIQIIATFNTGLNNIDPALLRSGRLKINWKFNKLTINNGKKLAKYLGLDDNLITEELTVSDIYHLNEIKNINIAKITNIGF